MKCPKCKSPMEKVRYQDIDVDRCTNCKGIWFDVLEKEDLKEITGSESIDIGDPTIGKQFNRIIDINCPKCSTKMVAMCNSKQRHICFEGCRVCYGVFFDAGEFKDYKDENILDFFKVLFKKEIKQKGNG